MFNERFQDDDELEELEAPQDELEALDGDEDLSDGAASRGGATVQGGTPVAQS